MQNKKYHFPVAAAMASQIAQLLMSKYYVFLYLIAYVAAVVLWVVTPELEMNLNYDKCATGTYEFLSCWAQLVEEYETYEGVLSSNYGTISAGLGGAAALLMIATIFVKNLTANKIMTAISGALAVVSGVLVLLLAMSAMDYLSHCEDGCCCKHDDSAGLLIGSASGFFFGAIVLALGLIQMFRSSDPNIRSSVHFEVANLVF
jgi:hypothetical protein